jgi:hypothetical protein
MTLEPVPDDPLGMLSQDAFGLTVQGQLACVVITAVKLPPGMHGLKSTGATEY